MNELKEKIAMMEFTKIILVAGLIGGMYYMFLFNDGSDLEAQIGSLSSQVAAEESKKAETQKTLAEQDRMSQSLGILNRQYVEISKRIPAELTSVEINKSIDTFSRVSGVSVLARNPLLPIKGEIVEEVPMEIRIRGKTEQVAQFIYLLTTSERILRIKNVDMSADESPDPNSPNVRLDGTIVGFRLVGDVK